MLPQAQQNICLDHCLSLDGYYSSSSHAQIKMAYLYKCIVLQASLKKDVVYLCDDNNWVSLLQSRINCSSQS